MDINVCRECGVSTQDSLEFCSECGSPRARITVKLLPEPRENVITRLRYWISDSPLLMTIICFVECVCIGVLTPLGIADLLAYRLPPMPLLVSITQSVFHGSLKDVPSISFITLFVGLSLLFSLGLTFVYWMGDIR